VKTILVTGSNGFVGTHLSLELSNHGYRVIGVDRNGDKATANYRSVDLTKSSDVQKIDFKEIDAVIHLAGLAAVGPSFDEPMKYITTNIGIEVNLFEAALQQNTKPKFLIISSGALYDTSAKLPLTEKSKVLPSSPYSVSKLGQEQVGLYYQTRGFECVIARPFNHIGPGQGLGFLLPDLAKQIADIEKDNGGVVLVGNLESSRDYTDVRDIVRAYRLLLEKGKSGEIYNICSGAAVSGNEILTNLVSLTNSKVIIKKDPERLRPSDTPILFGSNAKIYKDTGWKPEIKLAKTLSDVMIDWRKRV
jgi:GDP-4-dehydro-6-deoxy-D-mannose reductase